MYLFFLILLSMLLIGYFSLTVINGKMMYTLYCYRRSARKTDWVMMVLLCALSTFFVMIAIFNQAIYEAYPSAAMMGLIAATVLWHHIFERITYNFKRIRQCFFKL